MLIQDQITTTLTPVEAAHEHGPVFTDGCVKPIGGPATPATGARWLTADPAGLPKMSQLPLPGPRREWLGRGGVTAVETTIRLLIRCPLLDVCAEPFPAQQTGRPSPPARYWLFYGGRLAS